MHLLTSNWVPQTHEILQFHKENNAFFAPWNSTISHLLRHPIWSLEDVDLHSSTFPLKSQWGSNSCLVGPSKKTKLFKNVRNISKTEHLNIDHFETSRILWNAPKWLFNFTHFSNGFLIKPTCLTSLNDHNDQKRQEKKAKLNSANDPWLDRFRSSKMSLECSEIKGSEMFIKPM